MEMQIVLRIPTELIAAVDEFRRREPDIPVRSAAIRRLIEKGLGRPQTGPKKRKSGTDV